ncbi:MAG: hypothetical protein LBR80_09925 [Deltaproteobacteria bacterium]|jgi:hypothetical protein|nr:hypothetical protein [Deltaproteobacteria bacterium]
MIIGTLENDDKKGPGWLLMTVPRQDTEYRPVAASPGPRERYCLISVSQDEEGMRQFLQGPSSDNRWDNGEIFYQVPVASVDDNNVVLRIPPDITDHLVYNFFDVTVKFESGSIPDVKVQASGIAMRSDDSSATENYARPAPGSNVVSWIHPEDEPAPEAPGWQEGQRPGDVALLAAPQQPEVPPQDSGSVGQDPGARDTAEGHAGDGAGGGVQAGADASPPPEAVPSSDLAGSVGAPPPAEEPMLPPPDSPPASDDGEAAASPYEVFDETVPGAAPLTPQPYGAPGQGFYGQPLPAYPPEEMAVPPAPPVMAAPPVPPAEIFPYKPKGGGKAWVPILLGILLLLCAAGVAYYYINYYRPGHLPADDTADATPVPSEEEPAPVPPSGDEGEEPAEPSGDAGEEPARTPEDAGDGAAPPAGEEGPATPPPSTPPEAPSPAERARNLLARGASPEELAEAATALEGSGDQESVSALFQTVRELSKYDPAYRVRLGAFYDPLDTGPTSVTKDAGAAYEDYREAARAGADNAQERMNKLLDWANSPASASDPKGAAAVKALAAQGG